jgi:hypothetical protein
VVQMNLYSRRRVPLIIAGPAAARAGPTDELVSLVDIFHAHGHGRVFPRSSAAARSCELHGEKA